MKRIKTLGLVFLLVLMLASCTDNNNPDDKKEEDIYYTVTFDSKEGSSIDSQTVIKGGNAVEPSNDPTRDGYDFEYWYLDDSEVAYVFSSAVNSNITLTALWKEQGYVIDEEANKALIQQDIDALEASIYVSRYYIDTPYRGPVNGSRIAWSSDSKYISSNGVILPLLPGDDDTEASFTARFSLNGSVVYHEFAVELSHPDPVTITSERIIPFKNLTTEYDVADANVSILYEENGSVPYIRLEDFFNLLDGFIDPAYDLSYEYNDDHTVVTVSYDYLDEDEHQDYLDGLSDFDGLYHLTLIVDTVENTITTPDSGFYWAYVYSTETNYGRHIKYDRENENAYYEGGADVVYDLDNYDMDAVMYEGDLVLPYYVVNQLFAGSSYYNVYYNYDGLYGIYSLPSYGTSEYETIRTSSVSNTDTPADLAVHTFNFLGFAFNEFYGAQEVMGVDNYYDMLFGLKNQLLNTSAKAFDDILFNMINKDIDEPHTSYGYPGYYNVSDYIGPRLSSLDQLGTRMNSFYNDGLYAVDSAIAEKWGINGSDWAASSPDRPLYWFLDTLKSKAVLSLDDFNTSDIEESVGYDGSLFNAIFGLDNGAILPAFEGGNKYFYYNNSTQEYNMAEVLVKGLTVDMVDAYKAALVADGYVFDSESNTYSKSYAANTYYVKVDYDTTFHLFYVGTLELESSQSFNDYVDSFTSDIQSLVIADSAVYMEMYMELITAESSRVDTVLLDLTFNTGGNVGALYRVLGFITDQPFKVTSINAGTNSNSISYVYIDGVPNYSNLNWGLLQSPVTFSAANEMSTIFKENGLGVIIGTQSGGGASSITPILLPNGSAFTMSSNSINGYATETGDEENPYEFHSNEFGIVPDVYLSVDNFYDATQLVQILNTYYVD